MAPPERRQAPGKLVQEPRLAREPALVRGPALVREPALAREQQAPVRARPVAASLAPIHSRRDSGDVADRRLRWSRRAAIARRSGGSRGKR